MSLRTKRESPRERNRARPQPGRIRTKVVEEVLEARILQGIHFRFADEAGAKQGRKVASYVFKNFLLPVGGEAIVVAEDEEEEED